MSRAWMPMYWGDYKSDTAHLSTIEHGAYMLLIAHYWQTGSLPKDDDRLARIAGLDTETWLCVRIAIASFFTSDWKHKRIEIELKKADEKSSKAAKSAANRWNKGKKPIMRTHSEGICERNAKAMLSQSQSENISSNEDIAREPTALAVLSECMSEQTARDLIAHRQKLRKPLTARAAKLLAKDFVAYGNPEEAAEMMIKNGWQGFHPSWVSNQTRAGPATNGKGGMASLLAKSLGLKNGRESRDTDEALHVLPVHNRVERGNVGDDGCQLSGDVIDLLAFDTVRGL